MEDDALYNCIIVALLIGIAVVIVTLVVATPPEEYFTELYYTNQSILQKYVQPNRTYSYSVSVASHEKHTVYYSALATLKIFQGNSTNTIEEHLMNISANPGDVIQINVPYSLPEFAKAQVKFMLLDKDQEIHFWVYNSDFFFRYPDAVASIHCLNPLNLQPGRVTIRAKGDDNPTMKVRLDGVEVLSAVVNHTSYADYIIQAEDFSLLDIIFDNDLDNSTEGIDRNLYIKFVKINSVRVLPDQAVADLGSASKAFDCENIITTGEVLYWNSALRFRVGK